MKLTKTSMASLFLVTGVSKALTTWTYRSSRITDTSIPERFSNQWTEMDTYRPTAAITDSGLQMYQKDN